MTPTAQEVHAIVGKLSEALQDAIREAEPMGDHWWLPYTPGEEILERRHIFTFGTAQFSTLGLAVRSRLLEVSNAD